MEGVRAAGIYCGIMPLCIATHFSAQPLCCDCHQVATQRALSEAIKNEDFLAAHELKVKLQKLDAATREALPCPLSRKVQEKSDREALRASFQEAKVGQ